MHMKTPTFKLFKLLIFVIIFASLIIQSKSNQIILHFPSALRWHKWRVFHFGRFYLLVINNPTMLHPWMSAGSSGTVSVWSNRAVCLRFACRYFILQYNPYQQPHALQEQLSINCQLAITEGSTLHACILYSTAYNTRESFLFKWAARRELSTIQYFDLASFPSDQWWMDGRRTILQQIWEGAFVFSTTYSWAPTLEAETHACLHAARRLNTDYGLFQLNGGWWCDEVPPMKKLPQH